MAKRPARRQWICLLLGTALPLLAGAIEQGNWLRLEAMPRERRQILAKKLQEFDRLATSEQTAIRRLDASLKALPPDEQAEYHAVLRRYHLWLQSLSEPERTQLAQIRDPREKLARISQLRDDRNGVREEDPSKILFQLADLQGLSLFEMADLLKCWFQLGADERAEIDALKFMKERLTRLATIATKSKIPPVPRPSTKDQEAAEKTLNAHLQNKGWLRNQLKHDAEHQEIDRGRLINNFYFVSKPPKSVSSTNLLKFEEAMPSWLRTPFDHLTPEEARRRLTILYRLLYPAGTEIGSKGPNAAPDAPQGKAVEPKSKETTESSAAPPL